MSMLNLGSYQVTLASNSLSLNNLNFPWLVASLVPRLLPMLVFSTGSSLGMRLHLANTQLSSQIKSSVCSVHTLDLQARCVTFAALCTSSWSDLVQVLMKAHSLVSSIPLYFHLLHSKMQLKGPA